jgi:hypothetical protein
VAEGTHAATHFINVRKPLAAWIPLVPAERVRIRPIGTKVRAATLWDCLGEGSIRIQDARIQHENDCRDAHPAKQSHEVMLPH